VFRKSLKLYLQLLLKFAGPCFGILAYLTLLYLVDRTVLSSLQQSQEQVYYSQQRRVLVSTRSTRVVGALMKKCIQWRQIV
jgi:hypothetical protein